MSDTYEEATSEGEAVVFDQVGTDGRLAGIAIVNALLNIVTLTLYRFWGRTNVRRALWSSTTMNGEPFEYTGTGWELFKSFLIVTFGIFLPFYLLFVVAAMSQMIGLMVILIIGLYALLFWGIGFAIYAARRYRLSRTNWRGIRFAMTGSGNGYSWANIGYGLLVSLSMGWATPVQTMYLTRRMWRETTFGDRHFHIRVKDKDLCKGLYGPFAILWFVGFLGYIVLIGGLVALGMAMEESGVQIDPESPEFILSLYGVIFVFLIAVSLAAIPFQAAVLRRTAQIIGYEELSFELRDVTFGSLFGLIFGNLLIAIFTLGIGMPWTQLRTAQYVFRRLEAQGHIDFEAISQSQTDKPTSGEGLADAFDIGAV